MVAPVSPPQSSSLPTAAFTKVFDKVTSSHKFLWMLAILDVLSSPRFRGEGRPVIPMELLVYRMLRIAEGTLVRFQLAAYNDRFDEYLDLCRQRSRLFLNDDPIEEQLDIGGQIPPLVYNNLTRADSAPYRFLAPFLHKEVRITKKNVQKITQSMSKSRSPSPYHFSQNGKEIIIHSGWADYFAVNTEIIRGWALWHWARFLEVRYPGIPSLMAKISGVVRGNLALPRKLWDAAILRFPGEVRCIYSEETLNLDNYSIDHYLPWEFIGHDNFWNLAPTLKTVNSSKGVVLPDKRYLEGLAKIHHIAISTYHQGGGGN